MKLNYTTIELAELLNAEWQGSQDSVLLKQIQIDTRIMQEGIQCLFVCLDAKRAGVDFIPDAYQKGCRAFLAPKTYTVDSKFSDASFLLVDDVLNSIQLLAKKHRERFNYLVIGVTGSYGKTIVKEWLFHFLQQQYRVVRSPKSYNSQIGVALSVLQMNDLHELAIFEAGISQSNEMLALQEMIQPDIGVFTGLGNAHNAGFVSQQEKFEEKALLFQNCPVVISRDTDFYASENLHWSHIATYLDAEQTTFDVPDFGKFVAPFTNKHKVENLCAVLQVLKQLRFPSSEVQKSIDRLPQIAMRMELIQGKNNNLLINDAYALEGLDEALAYLKELAKDREKHLFLGFVDQHYLNQDWFVNLIKDYEHAHLVSLSGALPNTISMEAAVDLLQSLNNAVVLVKGQHGSGISKLIAPMLQRSHPTLIEINRQSLRNNITHFKKLLAPQTSLMVMVKAGAYGVGEREMANFLEREGVDYLGVAFPDEGVNLRKFGIELPIMVMNAHESAFFDVVQNNLEPAIFSLEQLDAFTTELVRLGVSNYPIHIKLETGMNRLGFRDEDLEALCSFLSSQPDVRVKSVYSHLAESGNADRTFTNKQLQLFESGYEKLQNALGYTISHHICNTDGIINYPEAHLNMVRLGIGLLGYANLGGLEQAIELKTKISKINKIAAGESLGYDRSYVAQENMEIAVLPIGYADGFRRHFGNGRAHVYINDKKCQVLGNVCMDMCFVDVTGVHAKLGDTVELIGRNVSVYDWADWATTIPYEIITGLSARLNRLWVD